MQKGAHLLHDGRPGVLVKREGGHVVPLHVLVLRKLHAGRGVSRPLAAGPWGTRTSGKHPARATQQRANRTRPWHAVTHVSMLAPLLPSTRALCKDADQYGIIPSSLWYMHRERWKARNVAAKGDQAGSVDSCRAKKPSNATELARIASHRRCLPPLPAYRGIKSADGIHIPVNRAD